MAAKLNPYLTFPGTAKQAMERYAEIFGGELTMNTFGEYGMEGAGADGIMHAQLETETDFTIMASDVPPGAEHTPGDSISISLSGDDAEALRGWWTQLSEGGTVTLPLEMQMWGDEFGTCVDQFGIPWMVNIVSQQS